MVKLHELSERLSKKVFPNFIRKMKKLGLVDKDNYIKTELYYK